MIFRFCSALELDEEQQREAFSMLLSLETHEVTSYLRRAHTTFIDSPAPAKRGPVDRVDSGLSRKGSFSKIFKNKDKKPVLSVSV